MRGRPRKPLRLHLLHGTLPRGGRANLDEPQPEPAIPDPPPHLQEVALEEWKRVAPLLADLKVLSELDRAQLAAYCWAYQQWVTASEELQKGLICKAPSGYPILSPHWSIATKALEVMRTAMSELGLSPASRTRIRGTGEGLSKPNPKSGVHRFLA